MSGESDRSISDAIEDGLAGEVAAMQFAGGMTVDDVAILLERDPEWLLEAIRQALLRMIPVRDGGTKRTRAELQAMRRRTGNAQEELWPE